MQFLKALVALSCVCAYGVQCASIKNILKRAEKVKQCGVEASEKPIHKNPWLVYLEYSNGEQDVPVRCGGTLISSRQVLTAAHCVKSPLEYNTLKARLGEFDLRTALDIDSGVHADSLVHINVKKVHFYKAENGDHDIAILDLEDEAPYTDFIRPICLPSAEVPEHTILTASGWGTVPFTNKFSDVKKLIELPLWSDEECRNVYKRKDLTATAFCAGGVEGIDTCKGDSGGPLTLKTKGGTQLYGITKSGPSKCGLDGLPGIYTSVLKHLHWIEEMQISVH